MPLTAQAYAQQGPGDPNLQAAPQFAGDVPPPGPGGDAQASQQQISGLFDNARQLFTAGNYPAALAEIDKAGALAPKDPDLTQFRAFCLFAQKDYRQAAAAIYAVLAAGPGWDWTTVSNLYPSTSTYTAQLRTLESYSQQNPNAADARFLLAYQYLVTGHNPQAVEELKVVSQLQPNDQLAAQLLRPQRLRPSNPPSRRRPARRQRRLPPLRWSAIGKPAGPTVRRST